MTVILENEFPSQYTNVTDPVVSAEIHISYSI